MECNDKNCFVHGSLRVRGRTFIGKVVSVYMKTAVIEIPRVKYDYKYKAYERVKSKLKAHNPPCINAKVGDIVKIGECRKISRTKAFTITEILSSSEGKV
ncbi:MAG: 30S ribosomal protein S17 [Candidatus Micrarchaeia archaeon]